MPDFFNALPAGWLSTTGTTFLLIALAEFGDKSQLVCMTLAARHRGLPVLLGAVTAFSILNLLAVVFGAAIAAWLPEWIVTAAVAVLFAIFGINSLRFQDEEDDEDPEEKPGHGIFVTTLTLIFLAEFGDKTQLAVAGIGSTASALPVWTGATIALACTSAAGIYAGRRLLNRMPLAWVHRISGLFFLALSGFAVWRLATA